MSDSSYPQAADDDAKQGSGFAPPPEQRAPLHQVVLALVRAGVSLLIVVWLYLSWDPHFGSASSIVFMAVGLVVFAGWTAWQGRRIVHADFPGLRAVEVLATVIPMFLMLFAGTYYSFSVQNDGAFNEVLNKGSALYFTIVVLSTTGFGDIVPKAGWARAAVNVQMLIDLFFIALVLRFILGAVNRGRDRRAQGIPAQPTLPRRRRRAGTSADDD